MTRDFSNYYTGDSAFLNEGLCPKCGTREAASSHLDGCPRIIQTTGSDYRCAAREIAPGGLRGVMPVMGVRLFHGLTADGEIVEFVMTGRGFATAEAKARAIAPTLINATFATASFEVDGVQRSGERRIDLTPRETTVQALRFGRAMGY